MLSFVSVILHRVSKLLNKSGDGQPPLRVSCAEDILSDSDSSEREEDAAITRRDNLMAAVDVVFEDVEPEYISLPKLKEVFEGWKVKGSS